MWLGKGKLVIGFLLIQLILIYYYNSKLPTLEPPKNYFYANRATPERVATVSNVGPKETQPIVGAKPNNQILANEPYQVKPMVILPAPAINMRDQWKIPSKAGSLNTNHQTIDPLNHMQTPENANQEVQVSIFQVQKGANEVGFMAAEKLSGNTRGLLNRNNSSEPTKLIQTHVRRSY
jgi:hypothetical protein